MGLSSIWQRLTLAIALVAILPGALVSQSSNGSPKTGQRALQEQLEMLKAGSRLRLSTGAQWQEGRLVLRTADSLGLRGSEGEVHLPLMAVDSAWVRRRHTVMGLLIGTLAGAGSYFLITKEEDDSDLSGLDNLVGAGVWAGSAVVGTVVGTLITSWKRVYPR